MKKYSELQPENKLIYKRIFEVILNTFSEEHNFCIETSNNNLYLRESTSNPPSAVTRAKIRRILQTLGFELEEAVLQAPLDAVRIFKISGFNEQLLALKLPPQNNVPDNVDVKTWITMPETIKKNWMLLIPSLRAHILTCLKERLEERYAEIQATMILGDTMRSPIGMSHPKVPVRLPTGPDVIYDLEELLQLSRRQNPMTREPFALNDILPAPEGLQKLLQRLAQSASANVAEETVEAPPRGSVCSLM